MSESQHKLFSVYGIELEYMIVDSQTLDVRPICDRIMHDVSGRFAGEIDRGEIAWSNELALHVIELKTNGPVSTLNGLADKFQDNVRQINELLVPHGARLLPTGMHPWMNPDRELQLWPHDHSPVYAAFDRIFDCKGHGWANVQSTHLNLPFDGDEEFGRLHAAIRLILPLLPGLAASSPVKDGRTTSVMDNRLEVYRRNSKRIPSVTGWIIPERAYDRASYQKLVFDPMFKDIARHDPEGILRQEFLNARGAIARFSRGSIEIRLLDNQECPLADIAICAFITEVLKLIVNETWSSYKDQRLMVTKDLHYVLLDSIIDAEYTYIGDDTYLRHFGIDLEGTEDMEIGEILELLLSAVIEVNGPAWEAQFGGPLNKIVNEGSLSSRIMGRTAPGSSLEDIRSIYHQLADCLAEGRLFGD